MTYICTYCKAGDHSECELEFPNVDGGVCECDHDMHVFVAADVEGAE